MKIEPIIPQFQKEKTEIHAQAEQRAEQAYVATLRPKKGERVWEIDLTKPVKDWDPVDVTPVTKTVNYNVDIIFDREKPFRITPMEMKPNHYYCTAINKRNAVRKCIKWAIQNALNLIS